MKRKTLILAVVLTILATGIAFAQAPTIEVHGYMLNRFYTPPSDSARFAMERLSLSVVAKLPEDRTAYAEVYYHPWLPAVSAAEQYRTYLESAYLDMPLFDGRIRIGKGRQLNFGLTPSYPNRKTTQYGILSETFTQDRIVGAQYCQKMENFDWGITLYTDQSIGTRCIGEYAGVAASKVVKHIVDKDIPSSNTGELAGSLRLGINRPDFQIHGSLAVGALNQADRDTIGAIYGMSAGANSNDDHSKWGFDAVYTRGPLVAQGEYYKGKFSFLEIDGYSLLVGYQPKDSNRLYVRYAELDNNRPANSNQLSWDTQQLTVGYVMPIAKGVWAEFQYEKNMEDPPAGTSKVKNDLLFVEFFTGF